VTRSRDALVYDPATAECQAQLPEIYTRLRDEAPVYRSDEGWFALSRFEDVRAAAGDPATFSSEATEISQGLLPFIQSLDPPRHDALRALVSRAFTANRIAAMEPRIRAIARDLLDAFAGSGRGDLLAQYARQLPSRVIGELIGIRPETREDFLGWTDALVEALPGDAGGDAARAPAASMYRAFAALLEERRRAPRDDLASALLAAEIDGVRLSERELLGFCFVLIVAGNDTTTNLVANGAVLLARHPDQRKLLAEDPARLPNAIEEMLRLESPAQALPRVLRRDVTLHGVRMPAGALVRLVWGAANRDPREFEEPERFDVARALRRHLGFGHGIHFCLGAHLARLEARIAFEELLARIPGYALEREPGWRRSIWARAHDAVPVVFDPA
jgi:hypothetical protein